MDESFDIRIGVSSCLLGEAVRFDGSGKRNRFVLDELGRFAELVSVCPEVEIGMPVPRPTLRLLSKRPGAGEVTMRAADGADWTAAMRGFAQRRGAELDRLELCGYVLKSNSPSCGMERVRVYDDNGVPSKVGRGLFADELMRAMPWLPVEEEGRLRDHPIREDFLDAVFALARWRAFASDGVTAAGLIGFHSRSKFQLLAHNPALYRDLGRLVARAGDIPTDELADQYLRGFMAAMRTRASRRRHVNVLQHLAGFVKRRISGASRREVSRMIEDYGRGYLPRSVPLVLLRHHAREQGVSYLEQQTYFQPFPLRLSLG